ncbi:Rapamycin-Insensitive Companion Of Mtor [Manis pentadactyla]|nr:Rapamycin-Insensitive Companion Of Mtor [Manis pentadactyla]
MRGIDEIRQQSWTQQRGHCLVPIHLLWLLWLSFQTLHFLHFWNWLSSVVLQACAPELDDMNTASQEELSLSTVTPTPGLQ